MFLDEIKEWWYYFLLTFSVIFGWAMVAVCVFAPIVLGVCFNPLWFCAWIITAPAAIATIIVLEKRGKRA